LGDCFGQILLKNSLIWKCDYSNEYQIIPIFAYEQAPLFTSSAAGSGHEINDPRHSEFQQCRHTPDAREL